ncbi:MAG: lipid II flippase MurJ [Caldilineaceae bacterium]
MAWLLAPRYGVYGLVMGVVAGTLGHLLVQVPGLFRYGRRLHAQPHPARRRCGEVARLMGPQVLGLFFVQMHFLVNTILASRLTQAA